MRLTRKAAGRRRGKTELAGKGGSLLRKNEVRATTAVTKFVLLEEA